MTQTDTMQDLLQVNPYFRVLFCDVYVEGPIKHDASTFRNVKSTSGELAPGPVGPHRCLTTEDHPYTKNSTLPPAI